MTEFGPLSDSDNPHYILSSGTLGDSYIEALKLRCIPPEIEIKLLHFVRGGHKYWRDNISSIFRLVAPAVQEVEFISSLDEAIDPEGNEIIEVTSATDRIGEIAPPRIGEITDSNSNPYLHSERKVGKEAASRQKEFDAELYLETKLALPPDFYFTPEVNRSALQELLSDITEEGREKYWVIVTHSGKPPAKPGTNTKILRPPTVETLVSQASLLYPNIKFVLLGTDENIRAHYLDRPSPDWPESRVVNLITETTVTEAMDIVARASSFFGPEGLLLFVALSTSVQHVTALYTSEEAVNKRVRSGNWEGPDCTLIKAQASPAGYLSI